MQYLQINNLTFKYTSSEIFSNLNLSFEKGWSCIVGSNGSGKTTLFKLIARILNPQEGNIIGNELVYYCEQELHEKPNGFDDFIYTYNTKTFKLKELLHIEDEWFYRWETLSFGERKRIQIAIALFLEPNVLLLDEPSNHLDIKTKEILIKSLKNFKSIGILISHDRELLNSLCHNTVIIKNKKIYNYKTTFQKATEELDSYFNFLQKENDNINSKVKKLQNNIQAQKEKVSQSKSRLSKKNVNTKDKSLKEKINLAKLTGKDKSDSKLVTSFSKKAHVLSSKRNEIEKNFDKGITIKDEKSKKEKFSFLLQKGQLLLGEKKILKYENLSLNKSDKIAIIGDNGVGKSSFLKLLISKISSLKNYLYLPQEIDLKQKENLFEAIKSLNNEKKGELFTLIQRLSSNPKNLLNNNTTSPGELRKLFIAKALLDNIQFIILDEPTNHMDIDSIESIEQALKEYQNTLIVVSHDKTFVKNIKARIYTILKGVGDFYELKEADAANRI
ncbi:ATP-binding cassette domain-containing protein [Candidatus Marinarcus aquaticus]|uniref:ABC transporter ATP-binding protein n=1 Tax=Candidatus Marinarcus aquaticus TaxID=2044504 RepID=A0A4Q0XPZ5_9BACT|nr:ATP-binding cassette domain-containing protein [Candidatus Marinarcus aquaticus]RXJ54140.1 ABC transporter ATP-binding protein [Candidatus Marinarcus aquaticus]